MDIITYLVLIVLGFFFLALGIYSGSYGQKLAYRDNTFVQTDTKLGATIYLLLLSTIIFIVATLNSFSIESEHCENQVTQTVLVENTTTYTNQISCIIQRHSYEDVAYLLEGLMLFNVILGIVYIVNRAL